MSKLIETRPPSGFRDYPPALMLPRERVLETARRVYRSYGFTPIDTPAAESLDVLLGKGGDESDKLVYRVRGAKSDAEEMGLRFDLTVPFARFAARFVPELGTPFKRYAMGPVWRGERPGQGRYREFWQCDFDTIGTTANAADVEAALVINDLFAALGFDRFEVRVNNRMVLNGLLETLGLADKAVPLLRSLDKLPKIGREKAAAEMVEFAGVTPQQADRVLALAETTGANADVLARVGASLGVDRLIAAMEAMRHPWLAAGKATPADVLVVQFEGVPPGAYQKVAADLRATGVATEVYPEAKKLKAQFEYADKRGFRLALIAGGDEFARGAFKLKVLATGEQHDVPAAELADRVRSLLAP